MDQIPCAANLREPCLRRNDHTTTCTDGECAGCTPRPAVHGYLCRRHYEQVERAWNTHAKLLTLQRDLGTDSRAVQPATTGLSIAGPRVPLTGLQLDLDSIERQWPGDVTTEDGALAALEWADKVHHAAKRYPHEDKPTRLHRVRCGNCLQQTAFTIPPDYAGAPQTIRCSSCSWQTDDPDHAEAAATVEAQVRDPYLRIKSHSHGRARLDATRAGIAALVDALRT